MKTAKMSNVKVHYLRFIFGLIFLLGGITIFIQQFVVWGTIFEYDDFVHHEVFGVITIIIGFFLIFGIRKR